jgi:hypothetical protein
MPHTLPSTIKLDGSEWHKMDDLTLAKGKVSGSRVPFKQRIGVNSPFRTATLATRSRRCVLEASPSPRASSGRWQVTLGCPKGVFRGCAPERPALKCRLNFLFSRTAHCLSGNGRSKGWETAPQRWEFADVAFVSFERWPKQRRIPRTEAWEVVPNLAVEVVSRTDSVDYIVDKVVEYFHAGVERVWVVFPSQEHVYVYESPTRVQILTRTDELCGEPILPQFRLPLGELFDDIEAVEGEVNQARQ